MFIHNKNIAKYAKIIEHANRKNTITPVRIDSRYIFLTFEECLKISESFFEKNSDSIDTISQQLLKNLMIVEDTKYINITVFLLIALMEFKVKRTMNNSQKILQNDSTNDDLNLILKSIKPRLENLLQNLLNKFCTNYEDGDTLKEIAKIELTKAFEDNIIRLIKGILNQSLGEILGVLQIDMENDFSQIDLIKDIIAATLECKQNKKLNENSEVIAGAIFAVFLLLCKM